MRKLIRWRGTNAWIVLAGLSMAPAPALAQEPPAEPPAELVAAPTVEPEVDTEVEAQDVLDLETLMSAANNGSLTFQVENDFFGDGTDRHYTNGLRISYVSRRDKLPRVAKFLKRITPFIGKNDAVRVIVAAGQNIFTPSDISRTGLTAIDRPYAGWLYGEIGLSHIDHGVRDSAIFSIGVVGPASLAKQTQRQWHALIGIAKPRGWANQLRNEPAILFLFEREWLGRKRPIAGDFSVDFSPRLGLALGNVFDYVAAGGMIRFGPNLPDDFGVPRIRPSLPGSGLFGPPEDGFDWYLFAGSEARLVARNIFLDGNTFRSSHSVDKQLLVVDAQAGLAMTFNVSGRAVRLSYALVFRSKEFDLQDKANVFGSISLSVQF